MASTNFYGAGGRLYDNYVYVDNCWHKGPTMGGWGTLSGERNGSVISGSVSASSYRPHGSYGYSVYIKVYANGNLIKTFNAGVGGNFDNKYFEWSTETNKATTISVQYECGQPGGCTKTTYGLNNNSISFGAYNPHSNPEISLGNNGSDFSKYDVGRNVSVWYKTDGHGGTINYTVNGHSFSQSVNGSTGGADITSSAFKPLDCGISRDSSYTVNAQIVDNNDGNFKSGTASVTLKTYRLPQVSISQSRLITIAGDGNVKNTITLSGNTGSVDNSASALSISINDGGNISSNNWTGDNGNNSQTYDYSPKIHGTYYTISSTRTHSKTSESSSATRYGYTYTRPAVMKLYLQRTLTNNNIVEGSGTSTNPIIFSPQDTPVLKWLANKRLWSSENDFTTYIKFANKNSVIGDNDSAYGSINSNPYTVSATTAPSSTAGSSYTDTARLTSSSSSAYINKIYTNAERSVNRINSSVTVTRRNTSANYTLEGTEHHLEASSTLYFILQYQPTKSPSNVTIPDKGTTVKLQDKSKIKVSWSYPSLEGGAGVVNKYKLIVYSSSSYSDSSIYWSGFINATSDTTQSYEFDLKTQLKRGVMNYIRIIPCYTKPDGTGEILGTQSYSSEFVRPISTLNIPVIDYPITGMTWSGNGFRILFTLPADDDFSTYSTEIQNNYRYRDIEVTIDTYSKKYKWKWSEHPEIFSTDTLSYRKSIAINPALMSEFPSVKSNDITIRVQKNYNFTEAEFNSDVSWSAPSNKVNVSAYEVKKIDVTSGQIISIEHYKELVKRTLMVYHCYPFMTVDENTLNQSKGDRIDRSDFTKIYDIIKSIWVGVNGYCTYDSIKSGVKFENALSGLSPTIEIITAQNTGVDNHNTSGKNYINILLDDIINGLK